MIVQIGSAFPTDRVLSRNPACSSSVLTALFPIGICAAELRTPGDPSLLFPEEARYLGASGRKRIGEFAAGRLCARRALAEGGSTEIPLEVCSDGQPQWPPEFTGSITHTEGFCGAVVAKRERMRALGVDAEIVGQVSPDIWPEVLAPVEALWIRTLPIAEQLSAAALIFSAKETFFKCQFAVTGQWLDFHEVTVSLSGRGSGGGKFCIQTQKKIALHDYIAVPLDGRFGISGKLVVTGMALTVA